MATIARGARSLLPPMGQVLNELLNNHDVKECVCAYSGVNTLCPLWQDCQKFKEVKEYMGRQV